MQRNWGNWMFYNTPKFFRLAKISLHSDSGNWKAYEISAPEILEGRDNRHSCRFLRKRKRASGEVVISGDPSCSWSAFWRRESCKRQQFFALFGVLIDSDFDHRTRLLTLGSKRKRQCVVSWEKNLKSYTLHIDFASVHLDEIDPEFLQDYLLTQTKSLFQQVSRLPILVYSMTRE